MFFFLLLSNISLKWKGEPLCLYVKTNVEMHLRERNLIKRRLMSTVVRQEATNLPHSCHSPSVYSLSDLSQFIQNIWLWTHEPRLVSLSRLSMENKFTRATTAQKTFKKEMRRMIIKFTALHNWVVNSWSSVETAQDRSMRFPFDNHWMMRPLMWAWRTRRPQVNPWVMRTFCSAGSVSFNSQQQSLSFNQ